MYISAERKQMHFQNSYVMLLYMFIDDLPDGVISKVGMYADNTTLFNFRDRAIESQTTAFTVVRYSLNITCKLHVFQNGTPIGL